MHQQIVSCWAQFRNAQHEQKNQKMKPIPKTIPNAIGIANQTLKEKFPIENKIEPDDADIDFSKKICEIFSLDFF